MTNDLDDELIDTLIAPNRNEFENDPISYSAMAYEQWKTLAYLAGYDVDFEGRASSDELKNPVLWLSHARALSDAATIIIKTNNSYEHLQPLIRKMADRQFCSVGLMLVGLSIEVYIKGFYIYSKGIEGYKSSEKEFQHHNLSKLAKIFFTLEEKDYAILRALTIFIYWAGRYPDPGAKKLLELEELFTLSEKFEITIKDIFLTLGKISEQIVSYIDAKAIG
ncbi:hypothetical protein [Pantoea dispersa]|uniref:hypothetical protein n=1 Tax=Pantoea dispersa TaxID=59814 RepID=UPI000FD965AD|nr:hypothetical protein [Pantoea dispersa]RVU78439.1 hypothetical protein EKH82_03595 [Pantoea dispersa]